MKLSSSLLLATFAATTAGVSAALVAFVGPVQCASEIVSHEGFIGADNNVKFSASHCNDLTRVTANGLELSRRQSSSDVCGAACDTSCFPGSSSGPNQADCNVIADALLYDNQNIGPLFNITASGTATDKITMQYKSCLTFFLNQDSSDLEYCRDDWSSLVTWLSSDCDAANNAHGGLCVPTDQRWFVQVQNTSG
ncbi:hypothetical protein BD311DRAFT_809046 [Dichomitus squalens]|uniref:Uncharacterized protein n=1 Tax=Dichomitus squalens TaxID=114155 RepID=A0A4Q9MGH6_9APHY|nr:hypothetical protein BD311DRAFT_809046 [Dichomitus squalens]